MKAFVNFGPVAESEVGARNGEERVEYGRERPILAVGEVRRLPQEPQQHAGTGAIRQEKTPTEKGAATTEGCQEWEIAQLI